MKKTTPFKAPADFEKDLTDFANRYRITLAEHSKRISEYFEMTCYNLIVRYYDKKGYSMIAQNLKGGKYKFKCSPKGHLQNFSYFKATKVDMNGKEKSFYVFHNATVQSAYDDKVFTTPDIVVAKEEKTAETTDYYATKYSLTYIPKDKMITFCEAKHLSPFPELMISFVGTVNELMPDCLDGSVLHLPSDHIAPSMMMSGTFGKSTTRIKESLESRYYVNYFDNLFEDVSVRSFLSMSQMSNIATLGKKSSKLSNDHQDIPDELVEMLNNT
jgi:hypothetical protein